MEVPFVGGAREVIGMEIPPEVSTGVVQTTLGIRATGSERGSLS